MASCRAPDDRACRGAPCRTLTNWCITRRQNAATKCNYQADRGNGGSHDPFRLRHLKPAPRPMLQERLQEALIWPNRYYGYTNTFFARTSRTNPPWLIFEQLYF